MSTPTDRPRSALVVIDVQNDVVGGAWSRDVIVGRIKALVDRARAEGVPVVWVQHSDEGMPIGSEGWRLVPEMDPRESEPLIAKTYGDSFEATDLEEVLAGLGVGRLVVSGAQTDACVRSTLHGAFTRGYDVTLVADAHTTEDLTQWGAPPPEQVVSHTNLYWSWQDAPGRTADVVAAADLDLAAAPGSGAKA